MGDVRYSELLGLDPAIEDPNYYELLGVSQAEPDAEAIERGYRERMTKLQQIKSPKHKGFIEYLKEELRNAKLALGNVERRKQYDLQLQGQHLDDFKKFAMPLMALGEVPKRVYETILQNAQSKHGLELEQAKAIVDELAASAGAKIILEEAPPPPPPPVPPPPAAAPYAGEPPAADAYFPVDDAPPARAYGGPGLRRPRPPGDVAPGRGWNGDAPRPREDQDHGEPPARRAAARRTAFYGDALGVPDPSSSPPAARGSEAPAESASPAARAAARRSFYAGGEPSASPEGPAEPAPPTARAFVRRSFFAGGEPSAPAPQAPPPPAWAAAEPPPPAAAAEAPPADPRVLEDARRAYNSGIKLARLALQAHHELQFYFPPANKQAGITVKINGVTYEDVAKTESKMWKEAAPYFDKAIEKLGPSGGTFADDLREKARKSVAAIHSYQEEWKQMNFRLMQGVPKAEELKLWQGHVAQRRLASLAQELDKPKEGA